MASPRSVESDRPAVIAVSSIVILLGSASGLAMDAATPQLRDLNSRFIARIRLSAAAALAASLERLSKGSSSTATLPAAAASPSTTISNSIVSVPSCNDTVSPDNGPATTFTSSATCIPPKVAPIAVTSTVGVTNDNSNVFELEGSITMSIAGSLPAKASAIFVLSRLAIESVVSLAGSTKTEIVPSFGSGLLTSNNSKVALCPA